MSASSQAAGRRGARRRPSSSPAVARYMAINKTFCQVAAKNIGRRVHIIILLIISERGVGERGRRAGGGRHGRRRTGARVRIASAAAPVPWTPVVSPSPAALRTRAERRHRPPYDAATCPRETCGRSVRGGARARARARARAGGGARAAPPARTPAPRASGERRFHLAPSAVCHAPSPVARRPRTCPLSLSTTEMFWSLIEP
ncbi:hypothetical protein EVAR_81296_1 [Eumeta japonica]|uniref:Uncharacterized protein n=1 Tax=Eumeta variegata TaxID=151549 RepID=A0A4C1VZZ2_EUMVA|nr:hypothetical protein EVAR_81296_1 [Eumeta japonica]